MGKQMVEKNGCKMDKKEVEKALDITRDKSFKNGWKVVEKKLTEND